MSLIKLFNQIKNTWVSLDCRVRASLIGIFSTLNSEMFSGHLHIPRLQLPKTFIDETLLPSDNKNHQDFSSSDTAKVIEMISICLKQIIP